MNELLIDDGLRIKEVLVTPQIAQGWLSKMAHNRKLSRSRVKQWAERLIERGQLPLVGDTFKFNEAGEFIDGPH